MSTIIQEAIVKHSRGTAAAWTSNNPVLEDAEWGYETDTKKLKIGDGATAWNSLAYQPTVAEVAAKASLSTYSTGWVANSDWTAAVLAVTHNLTANLSDLIVKFFISSDGTEANAIEPIFAVSEAAAAVNGLSIYHVSSSIINIYTGTSGFRFITNAGSQQLVDTESWHYKVKVYKLS